jgi:LPS-assembly protein
VKERPPAGADVTGDLARSLWLPRAQLPPPRAARLPEYCAGAYRTLSFPHPLDSDPDEHPIRTDSRKASYLIDGDIELEGDVRLQQGNRTLQASRVRLDQTTREGVVSGGVRLEEPGVVMQGDQARVNLDTHAATLEDVQFVLLDNALRGDARTLSQDGSGSMTMTRGSFTRCEPGNDNWRIGASSVEVVEGEVFGTARHAVLRVKRVPVFYAPYIRFPVTDDRQSGWLFPNLAYSDEDGTDVSLPYYLNLAPNYDATLIPRYVSDRGEGMEGELRHLSGWQETTLSAAFLYEDDLYDGELSRNDFEELAAAGAVTGEFEPEDRWLYAMDHSGVFGNFATRVDYTAVSDRDYFRDLGSDLGVSSQIELERRGEIQYTAGGLLMRLWAQRFQRLDEGPVDPYQRLPELDISYMGELPGPLEWSVATSLVTFERENDALAGLAAAVGDRIHVEPRVRLPLSAPWGYLTLTGGYRHTRYDLRDVPDTVDSRPERGIGLGIAHAGLFLERELSLFGAGLVQTLEPQVYYLYQEFEPQEALPLFDATALTFSFSQLFRDNRFSGVDRIGDANQASLGITTRFLNPSNGSEYVRASIGAINYFEDRRVTLAGAPGDDEEQHTSAVAGELAARIAGRWSATGTLIWDPHDSQWEEGAVGLQYRGDNRHIVNLGYRKRVQGDIQQTDASLYWPISRHYALMGRWNYDLVSGRTIEGFGGIEYNDCCWRIRLMARRFLDSPSGRNLETVEADEGIFLQIVFKGLAGFGDKVESVLRRGIRGYRTEMMDEY